MENNQRNNDPDKNNRGGAPNGGRNHSTVMIFVIVTLATLLVMSFFNNMVKDTTSREITYNEFLEMVDKGLVKKVVFGSDKLTIIPNTQPFSGNGVEISYYTGYTGKMEDPDLVNRLEKAGVEFSEEDSGYDYQPDFECGAVVCTPDPDLDFAWRSDAQNVLRRRHDGRGQEQSQGLCAERDRCDICRCGRSG